MDSIALESRRPREDAAGGQCRCFPQWRIRYFFKPFKVPPQSPGPRARSFIFVRPFVITVFGSCGYRTRRLAVWLAVRLAVWTCLPISALDTVSFTSSSSWCLSALNSWTSTLHSECWQISRDKRATCDDALLVVFRLTIFNEHLYEVHIMNLLVWTSLHELLKSISIISRIRLESELNEVNIANQPA